MVSKDSFVKAEPVASAGLATTLGIALATGVIDLSDAFEWHQFTETQSKAVLGLTGTVLALVGTFIARRKVSPTATVENLLEAAQAPVIVTNVIGRHAEAADVDSDAAAAPVAVYPTPEPADQDAGTENRERE